MVRKVTSLKEHQDIIYELLYVFDDFCKEHGIRYLLAYGTLLGAIRHNGIIPWDDDADIIMERSEYERFRKLIAKHPIEGYKAYDIDNTKDYYYPFVKFGKLGTRLVEFDWHCVPKDGIGINIDVFPIDGCPNDKAEAEKYVIEKMNKIFYYIRFWCDDQWKKQIRKRTLFKYPYYWFCKRRMFLKPFFKRLYREPLQYRLKDSTLCYSFWSFYGTKILLPKYLIESTELHKFGDRMLPIPKDFDTILKTLYGDYMMVPPENKRQSTHVNELFIDE